MVRSMLLCRNVPKHFWLGLVRWVTYVMNNSPTFIVKNMTLKECWSVTNSLVPKFRVFVCVAHAHVPDTQRKKLDGKRVQCVNHGVSEESKAYKLYEPAEGKFIIS